MRSAGIPIEALKKYVALFHQPGTENERKNILIEQRQILQERYDRLTETIKRLDYKIEHYDSLHKPAPTTADDQ